MTVLSSVQAELIKNVLLKMKSMNWCALRIDQTGRVDLGITHA